jgi:hypothetical protein
MGTVRTKRKRRYLVTVTPDGGTSITGWARFIARPRPGQAVTLAGKPAEITVVHRVRRPATAHPETADNAGLIRTVRSRQTGHLVSLYRAAAAGIENDPDPALRYAMVCEAHAGVVCVESQARGLAELPRPNGWCPTCQEIVELAAKEAERDAGDTSVILAERITELRRLIALANPAPEDGAR